MWKVNIYAARQTTGVARRYRQTTVIFPRHDPVSLSLMYSIILYPYSAKFGFNFVHEKVVVCERATELFGHDNWKIRVFSYTKLAIHPE